MTRVFCQWLELWLKSQKKDSDSTLKSERKTSEAAYWTGLVHSLVVRRLARLPEHVSHFIESALFLAGAAISLCAVCRSTYSTRPIRNTDFEPHEPIIDGINAPASCTRATAPTSYRRITSVPSSTRNAIAAKSQTWSLQGAKILIHIFLIYFAFHAILSIFRKICEKFFFMDFEKKFENNFLFTILQKMLTIAWNAK